MSWLNYRFRSLYWRQMFITTGMVLLTLALLGVAFFTVSYQYARYQTNLEMENRARMMGELSADYLEYGRQRSLERFQYDPGFQQLSGYSAVGSYMHFLICDERGGLVLSTGQGLGQESVPENLVARLLEGEPAVHGKIYGPDGQRFFAVGVPAVKPGTSEQIGLVFALSANTSLDTMWQGFTIIFFITAFAVLLISIAVSSITSSRFVQPLSEMARAARQYGEGDFAPRMPDDQDSPGEIGELAASFNQMAESLERQESQRREFISNLSHDLKTPLTTIAGYTDGILDGTIPPERERQYLRIISEESRRLSRMVRRMLDVSQIQAIDPMKSGATFDICERMRRVLISMEKKITDRKLDVDADIPDGPIFVPGDKDMMTQVLYNLLENAAKFAREGSTLYLGLEPRDGRVYVTVRNLGETIPPEELPLLFDRFHKSDKSRNEDKDGVGLGLYIVRTILHQHREEIYATSENGVTEFSFSLRIA